MERKWKLDMREIKFRVWDNISSSWLTSNCGIFTIGLDGELYFQDLFGGDRTMEKVSNSINYVICQYTGLKDKNGVEIYEGDILKSTYNDEIDSCDCGIGELEFYEGIWYVAGEIQNGLYDIDKCNEIEVIGNIYENKELLEEEK